MKYSKRGATQLRAAAYKYSKWVEQKNVFIINRQRENGASSVVGYVWHVPLFSLSLDKCFSSCWPCSTITSVWVQQRCQQRFSRLDDTTNRLFPFFINMKRILLLLLTVHLHLSFPYNMFLNILKFSALVS